MPKQREGDSFHEVSETRSKPLPLPIEWKDNRRKTFPLFVPLQASLAGDEKAEVFVHARERKCHGRYSLICIPQKR